MAPVIAAAMGLAKYAPALFSVFKSIKDSGSKTEAAHKIVTTAASVLTANGKSVAGMDPLSILQLVKDTPNVQTVLKSKLELEQDTYKLYLDDVKDARKYTEQNKDMLFTLARNVMVVTPFYVIFMVLMQFACMIMFADNGMILALIGNLVGLIVGQLLGERLQVLNFYFGSSVVPDTRPINKDD